MPTIKQRDSLVQRRLARVDRVLTEATRRNLDPLLLIERGIRNHDKRAKTVGQAVPSVSGVAAVGPIGAP
jgi:hypothetical protein